MAEWQYEKLDENYNLMYCPMNDFDGSITGHIVIGVKQWFDENPEERKRRGWIKHITHDPKETKYDKQTQYLIHTAKVIDEYTIEDEYHVMNKSEEIMLFEELFETVEGYDGILTVGGLRFYGGE